MSKRVYPTDPNNLLVQPQQQMLQPQPLPQSQPMPPMPIPTGQAYPQPQQPMPLQHVNLAQPGAYSSYGGVMGQPAPPQTSPVAAVVPPPTTANTPSSPPPPTTVSTSKRQYVVDADNSSMLTNAMGNLNVNNQPATVPNPTGYPTPSSNQGYPTANPTPNPTGYPSSNPTGYPTSTYPVSPTTQPYGMTNPTTQPHQPAQPPQPMTASNPIPMQQSQPQQPQQPQYDGYQQQQQYNQQQYTQQPQYNQQYQQQQPHLQQQYNNNIASMPGPMQMATQPVSNVPYHQGPQSSQSHQYVEQTLPTTENLCPKSYMRMSMNAIPHQASNLTKTHIPLGCTIHPFANDEPIPIVSSTIVRCKRCRAYINPFVTWMDGGGRWRCNVCDMINETQQDYFSPIDLTTGKRADINNRPELKRGCVEFLATSEYTIRGPQPPSYFFVIDVCYESIVSGMLNCAIESIKASLDNIPGDSRARIGFLTFDDSLHFYNLKSSFGRPKMYVVTEMDNIFVPPYEEFLVNLKESRAIIDSCLDIIKQMERKTQKVESCLGSALKAALQICQGVGGKIIVLQSYIPRGPFGKLPIREFQSVLGTKKETQMLQPQDAGDFYKDLGLACSSHHLSVDLFLFATDYVDVASLQCLPQITGGELFYFPAFIASRDGQTFAANLMHTLTRPTGWESVMRVRTSRGISTNVYHGNYFLKTSDLLSLPTIDADKSFTLQMGISDTITSKYVAIQAALLYTHSCGERRVRVFTISVPVVHTFPELFKYADIAVVTSLISKMAIDKALASSLSDAREAIANKCVDILMAYKQLSSTSAASSSVTLSPQTPKLLLPESLKHLPLYVVAMVKNIVFTSKATHPDMRAFFMHRMKVVDLTSCLNFFYPQFYSMLKPAQQTDQATGEPLPSSAIVPATLKLSSDQLSRAGIFILVNGFAIYLYVGEACPPQTLYDIFGCDYNSLDPMTFQGLSIIDNEQSRYARKVIEMARGNYSEYQRIILVKSNDKLRGPEFTSLLIEDRTLEGGSYYEFILQLQQRIQQK